MSGRLGIYISCLRHLYIAPFVNFSRRRVMESTMAIVIGVGNMHLLSLFPPAFLCRCKMPKTKNFLVKSDSCLSPLHLRIRKIFRIPAPVSLKVTSTCRSLSLLLPDRHSVWLHFSVSLKITGFPPLKSSKASLFRSRESAPVFNRRTDLSFWSPTPPIPLFPSYRLAFLLPWTLKTCVPGNFAKAFLPLGPGKVRSEKVIHPVTLDRGEKDSCVMFMSSTFVAQKFLLEWNGEGGEREGD